MHSLFHDQQPERKQVSYVAAASTVIHVLLLALIVTGTIRARRIVVFYPKTRGSVRAISTIAYNRGALVNGLSTRMPDVADTSIRPQPVRKARLTPAPSNTAQQASPAPAKGDAQSSGQKSNPGVTGAGNDAESMDPASPLVSPSPQVKDRSLLPQTDQRVIVDVDLDASGHVLQARLVSGIGNALDQIALDTVRTWQFRPAMLNGKAMPSVAEVVFPFNRDYPIAN